MLKSKLENHMPVLLEMIEELFGRKMQVRVNVLDEDMSQPVRHSNDDDLAEFAAGEYNAEIIDLDEQD